MKKTIIFASFLISNLLFGQDSTQVKHTHKISKLLEKVHIISAEHIDNKEQVINKSKIDEIKTEKPNETNAKKQDSLIAVINSLQSINFQKDSLIIALKSQLIKQQQTISLNPSKNSPKNIHNYIVLGAYLIKSNAEKQVRNLQQYQLEIITIPSGKLHYVVYSLKSNEKINPILFKFRKQIEPNAWIISF